VDKKGSYTAQFEHVSSIQSQIPVLLTNIVRPSYSDQMSKRLLVEEMIIEGEDKIKEPKDLNGLS